MLRNPVLTYCFHAEFPGEDRIILSSEKESILLAGRPYFLIISKLVANPCTTDELVTSLQDELSPFEIYYILDVLEKKGYLTEAAPFVDSETAAFWNNRGMDINRLMEHLKEKRVGIYNIDVSEKTMEDFRKSLISLSITTGEPGNLNVYLANDYRHEKISEISKEALVSGRPWMLIKPEASQLWLGPLFIPGRTGCAECLKQRLDLHHPLDMYFKSQMKKDSNLRVPPSYIPHSVSIAANLVALEIANWLYYGKSETLEGKIVTLDTGTLKSESHFLVKRPQCKQCGIEERVDLRTEMPEGIVLEKKTSVSVQTAGGYRDMATEDTLEKYSHHVSEITGIVKALKPYYSMEGAPLYNYTSGPNTSLRSNTLYWLNSHMRSANGGKGKTHGQAKTGALCEAIERYSMTYQGDEPTLLSSLEKLGPSGIHPNTYMNFSLSQYANREEINSTCSRFYSMIPVPFDPHAEIPWTPVFSLRDNTFKYLPTAFCYTQFPSQDETKLFSYPDSNGCAAGNSIEEAILQGILELIERDSVALWWYNRIQRPGVDFLDFNEPYFFRLKDYYNSMGRRLYVLDLTSDFEIPAFGAFSYREGDRRQNVLFGFGAHVDAKIALERALVELNQILPIAEARGTDAKNGKYLVTDKVFVDWLENATLENQRYLAPLQNVEMKKTADYRALCAANVYDSVMFCLEKVKALGMETLVLNLTRRDIGMPVVRVMIPGLRHFWKRLGKGRLYDVPVKMGWLDSPLKEEDMNPIGLFI